MPYCPNCGNEIVEAAELVALEAVEPVEVTLARIEAERSIAVARIAAGETRAELSSAETIAVLETDAQVESAEIIADALAPEPEPEPDDTAPPLLELPELPDAEDVPEDAPPLSDAPPPPPGKGRGLGMW